MCQSDSKNHIVMGKRLNMSQGRKPKKKIGITTTIMRCPDCNLVYSNPMPVPKDIQYHYGIPPESYWSEEYFRPAESDFLREINKLKTFMNIAPGSKSLELGAGIGKHMIALGKAGFDAYGLEPS